ncbi:MAG: Anthranilate phosphoribosyltransferase [Chthoniobacteraceae bacterium]|nr:Anthranilate phosphoribosyltransferase [Chthoniobacteraceae bacterium]
MRIAARSPTVCGLMHELISHLTAQEELSTVHVEQAVTHLLSDEITDESKAAFLLALRAKGETAAEIAAFVQALLRRAIDPGLDAAQLPGPMIDVCGTGGDKMELFNISTASMFVLAAGGAIVVKHGNRAITSQCGGADVLEALGVRIDLAPADLKRCVESLGLGFVFAPSYHPAFKTIAPVRRQLAAQGIPTIFNMLGPLLNPARPAFQMVGVFSSALLGKYAHSLSALGRKRAWALNGDGTDELTITGPSDVHEVTEGALREFVVSPAELGINPCELAELRGGDKTTNAAILVGILDGTERGAKSDIVALNAAAGFVITGLVPDLGSGLAMARERIANGSALARLRALQQFA